MASLTKCDNCNIKYPAEILAPIFGLVANKGSVCGICALKLVNEHLGVKRERFAGGIAEGFRLDAIEWRKRLLTKKK